MKFSKNYKIKKIKNYNINNNYIGKSNEVNERTKYSRKDFLKLLRAGTIFLTMGGLFNHKLESFENTSIQASATTMDNPFTVDNIQLITGYRTTVRAFASSNSTTSNYYEVTAQPKNGRLNWAGRTMTFTSNINFIGTDSFNYHAIDNNVVISNECYSQYKCEG